MNNRLRRIRDTAGALLALAVLAGLAITRPRDLETPIERRYRKDAEADIERQVEEYRRYRGER